LSYDLNHFKISKKDIIKNEIIISYHYFHKNKLFLL
jgi:hypothetical protein